ncbi:MAG: CapA family protein [Oscillospiraceae bacterium]|nr:CapA family protein [Oscillospiraceae bacterium]
MAQNDDNMAKRRARRDAMRAKKEAQQRKMKRTLILAAVILVLCAGGLISLLSDAPADQNGSVQLQETTAPPETTKPPRSVVQDPITTIHIKAAGDLNVTDSVIRSGLALSGYDFSRAFQDVAAILADADLTVMNFEGNVYGEPYGTKTTSAPMQLLKDLRACGVDLLQMANSCAVNNGLNGLTSTLQAIRAAGMEPIGAYSSDAEFNVSKGYTITEVNGIRVAFVAFTKGLGGRGMPAGNENLVNLLYTDYATTYKEVDKDRIDRILKNVENEDPDITIALLHWGSEYNDDISATQQSIVSLMKKGGVDIILGTHPHTLQPIVFDEAAGTLVCYSLGDFFGDAERGATNYSIILDIEITKDADAGTTKVTGYSITPIYTVKESECVDGDRRVVRIDRALQAHEQNFLDKVTDACYSSMSYALTRIDQRIKMPEATKK